MWSNVGPNSTNLCQDGGKRNEVVNNSQLHKRPREASGSSTSSSPVSQSGPNQLSSRSQSSYDSSQENCISIGSKHLEEGHNSISSGSPLTRYKHAVCSAPSGFIYIFGGRFGNLPLDDDVWRFDPHHNQWSQLSTRGHRPPSLQEHSLVEYGDHLYMFGGQISSTNSQGCFWRLDLVSLEWNLLSQPSSMFGAHLGPTNRRGHSAVVYSNCMYIFGGFEDFRGSSAQLWEYNLICETWQLRDLSSTSACRPEPRHGHSAIVHRDSMYIYGGLSNLKPLNDMWRWSWRDKRWYKLRSKGKSPGHLHGHTSIQAFDSMFVFGGERQGKPTRSLWRLNLNTLVWQKIRPKGPRPNPTTWHVAIANPLGVLDEANYIVEGADSDDERELVFKTTDFLVDQHQHQQEQHCAQKFPSAKSTDLNGTDVMAPCQIGAHNGYSVSHSKSTSNCPQQVINNSRFNKLRFSSFLRSQGRQTNGLKRGLCHGHGPNHAQALRVSASENNFRPPTNLANGEQNGSSKTSDQSSSIEQRSGYYITENIMKQQTNANNTVINNEPRTNSDINNDNNDKPHDLVIGKQKQGEILDSLDIEIKEMFEQVLDQNDDDSPSNSLEQHEDNSSSRIRRSMMIRNSLTSSNSATTNYESARNSAQLNSRFSQITSGAYSTAKSEIPDAIPLSQATSSSTLKNVNANETFGSGHNDKNHQITIYPLKQKQQHQHNSQLRVTKGYEQSKSRPKSEIVQSLIEQADARIKHLYTPHFRADEAKSNPRSSSREHFPTRQANHRNRFSLSEMTKRHTIHQTMTYYNLYFSEDKYSPPSDNNSTSGDTDIYTKALVSNQGAGDIEMDQTAHESVTRDPTDEHVNNGFSTTTTSSRVSLEGDELSLSSNTVKDLDDISSSNCSSGEQQQQQQRQQLVATTSGNLVGIRTQSTTTPSTGTDQESLNSSIESRTLTKDYEDPKNVEAGLEITTKESKINAKTKMLEEQIVGSTLEDDDKASMSRSEVNCRDNTSLSFSVIAEFEEDDMLQYSSPTEPVNHLNPVMGRGEQSNDHNDSDAFCIDNDNDDDSQRMKHHDDGDECLDDETSGHGELNVDQLNGKGVAHQSSSSGYNSNSISHWNEGASVAPGGMRSIQTHEVTSDNNNTNSKLDNEQHLDHNHRYVPPGSSTTSDSLAFNSDIGFESPLSPRLDTKKSSGKNSRVKLINGETRSNQFCDEKEPTSKKEMCQTVNPDVSSILRSRTRSIFGKRKSKRRRYWQLCMFVIGGKQAGSPGSINEPISIWRLYI